MFISYAFVFGIYINLDVFYSIWTYTKYNNSLEILITACVSIFCQYWWIFLDFNYYIIPFHCYDIIPLVHFCLKFISVLILCLTHRYTMNTTYRHLYFFLLEKSMSSSKQKIHIHLHLADSVALLLKSWSIFYSPK